MLRTISLVLLVSLLSSQYADACGRCGLFGRKCRYAYAQKVQQAVVVHKQQAAVAVPQQVVNVSNIYPVGATQYSLGAVAQLQALNPDLAVTAAARVAENAVASLSSSITAGLIGNADVAQLAKVQAATSHLQAAIGEARQGSLTLQITQSGGGLQFRQVEGPQTGEQLTDNARGQQGTILGMVCAKCHGLSLAAPKGELFLDRGHPIDGETVARALDAVRLDKMPKDRPLKPEEKALVMQELLELFVRRN